MGTHHCEGSGRSSRSVLRDPDFWGNTGPAERVPDGISQFLNPRTMLVVGCGKGFLEEALRQRGIEVSVLDVRGDSMDLAVPGSPEFRRESPGEARFDLVSCLDVLDGLSIDAALAAIDCFSWQTDLVLFSANPSDPRGTEYPDGNAVLYWLRKFAERGFYPDVAFDASFVSPWAFLLRSKLDPSLSPVPDALLTSFAGQIGKTVNLEEIRVERNLLRARVDEMQDRVCRLDAAVKGMMGSSSWKITAPARRILRLVRRIRQSAFGVRVALEPHHDLERRGENGWRATGPDPHFTIRVSGPFFPGWMVLDVTLETSGHVWSLGKLYPDTGEGYSEETAIRLPLPANGHVRHLFPVPPGLCRLRYDPMEQTGEFEILGFSLQPVRMPAVVRKAVSRALSRLESRIVPDRPEPEGARPGYRMLRFLYRRIPLPKMLVRRVKPHVLRHLVRKVGQSYSEWVEAFDTIGENDRIGIRRQIREMPVKPLFSVLMPVYDIPGEWLGKAIDSVRNQLYPDWELCLADDASTAPSVRRLLRQYETLDRRIRVVYRKENGHVCHSSNSALELAGGEWVVLLDCDDLLAEHALYMVALEILARPDARILYSDEDKIDGNGVRYDPYFKPDFSPDLLLSQNYINHLAVYRTDLVREAGGFRPGLEGAQDYDLLLRCIEKIRPEQIRHLPRVLYHWRASPGSTAKDARSKPYAVPAARRAVRDHLSRTVPGSTVVAAPGLPQYNRVVRPLPDPAPTVSILIPTGKGIEILRPCLDSLFEQTDYPDFEVIVDNGATDRETLSYLGSLAGKTNLRVLKQKPGPFNYSAVNNEMARIARGEILVLLNDDTEIVGRDWLRELVSHAVRREVGAVGARLLYPGRKIQHVGVILGIFGLGAHPFSGEESQNPGQMGRNLLVQNFSAVTGACLAIRRDLFREVGGLDEVHLMVAFNDVDLCLRVREKGYLVVYTPHAELVHHESRSLGPHNSPSRSKVFDREVQYMRRRWKEVMEKDPYYNPNLSLNRLDFGLSVPPRAAAPWKEFFKEGGLSVQEGHSGERRPGRPGLLARLSGGTEDP